MASINEVYGNNYQDDALIDAIKSNVRIITNNITNQKINFRYDSKSMWSGMNMNHKAVKMLIDSINNTNTLRLTYIDKRSNKVAMFPYLVNGAVEYFVLTDMSKNPVKLYSIYITPTIVEAI